MNSFLATVVVQFTTKTTNTKKKKKYSENDGEEGKRGVGAPLPPSPSV